MLRRGQAILSVVELEGRAPYLAHVYRPSRPGAAGPLSLAELTVHKAEGDLLDIDPLDLGPTPAGRPSPALAVRLLAGLRLLATEPIVPLAMRIGGTMLRSPDAIHLATAASISGQLGALITYDRRMIGEGRALGLMVLSPT